MSVSKFVSLVVCLFVTASPLFASTEITETITTTYSPTLPEYAPIVPSVYTVYKDLKKSFEQIKFPDVLEIATSSTFLPLTGLCRTYYCLVDEKSMFYDSAISRQCFVLLTLGVFESPSCTVADATKNLYTKFVEVKDDVTSYLKKLFRPVFGGRVLLSEMGFNLSPFLYQVETLKALQESQEALLAQIALIQHFIGVVNSSAFPQLSPEAFAKLLELLVKKGETTSDTNDERKLTDTSSSVVTVKQSPFDLVRLFTPLSGITDLVLFLDDKFEGPVSTSADSFLKMLKSYELKVFESLFFGNRMLPKMGGSKRFLDSTEQKYSVSVTHNQVLDVNIFRAALLNPVVSASVKVLEEVFGTKILNPFEIKAGPLVLFY